MGRDSTGEQAWVSQRGLDPDERFLMKVDIRVGECWPWFAALTGGGYGNFTTVDGWHLAHRYMYELVAGPIPAGLDLDHLCRNRACVNPLHLEPVTRSVNLQRGHDSRALTGMTDEIESKGPCRHGHPAGSRSHRPPHSCRTCKRDQTRDYRTHKAGKV